MLMMEDEEDPLIQRALEALARIERRFHPLNGVEEEKIDYQHVIRQLQE